MLKIYGILPLSPYMACTIVHLHYIPCSDLLKYTRNTMYLIHVIKIYYGMFVTENEVYGIYSSFKGTHKIISLYYSLLEEIACNVF